MGSYGLGLRALGRFEGFGVFYGFRFWGVMVLGSGVLRFWGVGMGSTCFSQSHGFFRPCLIGYRSSLVL